MQGNARHGPRRVLLLDWPRAGCSCGVLRNWATVSCIAVVCCRSLPKLSSQDEDGPTPHTQFTGVQHFEPIPHDHDFCERVVINVSAVLMPRHSFDLLPAVVTAEDSSPILSVWLLVINVQSLNHTFEFERWSLQWRVNGLLNQVLIFFTECRDPVLNTPAPYLGGPGLKSWPGERLSWLRVSVVFLRPSR
jgi:hypothetical protein